jgi:hypothetical protein
MYYEAGHQIALKLYILHNLTRFNKIQARITPASDAVLPITVWRRKNSVNNVTGYGLDDCIRVLSLTHYFKFNFNIIFVYSYVIISPEFYRRKCINWTTLSVQRVK